MLFWPAISQKVRGQNSKCGCRIIERSSYCYDTWKEEVSYHLLDIFTAIIVPRVVIELKTMWAELKLMHVTCWTGCSEHSPVAMFGWKAKVALSISNQFRNVIDKLVTDEYLENIEQELDILRIQGMPPEMKLRWERLHNNSNVKSVVVCEK